MLSLSIHIFKYALERSKVGVETYKKSWLLENWRKVLLFIENETNASERKGMGLLLLLAAENQRTPENQPAVHRPVTSHFPMTEIWRHDYAVFCDVFPMWICSGRLFSSETFFSLRIYLEYRCFRFGVSSTRLCIKYAWWFGLIRQIRYTKWNLSEKEKYPLAHAMIL